MADGVIAAASVRGQPIALTGPPTIEAGKTETYTGPADINVVSTDVIAAAIACSNCPLTPSGVDPNEYVSPWEREQRMLQGKPH